MLARQIDRRHQARPYRAELDGRRSDVLTRRCDRIKRTGFHQALQHALVHQPQIELITERVQGGDAAL